MYVIHVRSSGRFRIARSLFMTLGTTDNTVTNTAVFGFFQAGCRRLLSRAALDRIMAVRRDLLLSRVGALASALVTGREPSMHLEELLPPRPLSSSRRLSE